MNLLDVNKKQVSLRGTGEFYDVVKRASVSPRDR